MRGCIHFEALAERRKPYYEQCLEEVRRRRLELNGGELTLANRLLSLSDIAPPPGEWR